MVLVTEPHISNGHHGCSCGAQLWSSKTYLTVGFHNVLWFFLLGWFWQHLLKSFGYEVWWMPIQSPSQPQLPTPRWAPLFTHKLHWPLKKRQKYPGAHEWGKTKKKHKQQNDPTKGIFLIPLLSLICMRTDQTEDWHGVLDAKSIKQSDKRYFSANTRKKQSREDKWPEPKKASL